MNFHIGFVLHTYMLTVLNLILVSIQSNVCVIDAIRKCVFPTWVGLLTPIYSAAYYADRF